MMERKGTGMNAQLFEIDNQEVRYKSATEMGSTGAYHLEIRLEIHRMLSV
jgi:hypothetical protein